MRVLVFGFCVAVALMTFAQGDALAQADTDMFSRINSNLTATFPNKHLSIREGTNGDLNGDGIKDYAVVIVLDGNESQREERLVVLVGTSDGNFRPLSVSGQFCEPQKFYDLSIRNNSLFVESVNKADASAKNSFTLQFRFNLRVSDLELIGSETNEVEYDENSSYKVSVNYLTRVVKHSRLLGKSYIERRTTTNGIEEIVEHSRRSSWHKEATTHFDSFVLPRLQGFDCASDWEPSSAVYPSFYIDETFQVKRQ